MKEATHRRPAFRVSPIVAVLTALGVVALVIGTILDTRRALYAYLAAYAFVASTTLGALIFLAIVHAMGARWPVALRRLVEAVVALVPLVALLLVPVLVGMKAIYPWLRLDSFADPHARELVEHRVAWLNAPFFLVRAALVLGSWVLVAVLLRRWSLRQDGGSDPALVGRMRKLSAGALPVLGITASLAAFDWLMSLTPEWYTTMYGVYFFAGGFLAALATLTLAAGAAHRRGAIPELRQSHYYALGRLLLAFTIFWAYIAYFQFFLIWIANRPVEASWYLDRMRGGWGGVSVLLAVGQFVLPFLFLLLYWPKRHRLPMMTIAGWILALHYVDSYWLVLPSLRAGLRPSWMDLAALLAVGGIAYLYGRWVAARHPLVALGDPRLAEALAYESA